MPQKFWVERAPKAPDHKAVIYEFNCKQDKRPGYWKINSSIINEQAYKSGKTPTNSLYQ